MQLQLVTLDPMACVEPLPPLPPTFALLRELIRRESSFFFLCFTGLSLYRNRRRSFAVFEFSFFSFASAQRAVVRQHAARRWCRGSLRRLQPARGKAPPHRMHPGGPHPFPFRFSFSALRLPAPPLLGRAQQNKPASKWAMGAPGVRHTGADVRSRAHVHVLPGAQTDRQTHVYRGA